MVEKKMLAQYKTGLLWEEIAYNILCECVTLDNNSVFFSKQEGALFILNDQ